MGRQARGAEDKPKKPRGPAGTPLGLRLSDGLGLAPTPLHCVDHRATRVLLHTRAPVAKLSARQHWVHQGALLLRHAKPETQPRQPTLRAKGSCDRNAFLLRDAAPEVVASGSKDPVR